MIDILFSGVSESVSAPSLKRRAQFKFLADECSTKPNTINAFQQNLNNAFKGMFHLEKNYDGDILLSKCQYISYINHPISHITNPFLLIKIREQSVNLITSHSLDLSVATSNQRCKGQCRVNLVHLSCGGSTNNRKLRRRGLTKPQPHKQLIIAKFEVQVDPRKPTGEE